ncbi:MAG: hypothetical protein ACLUPK_08345 [Veillonella sp.]
MAVQIERCKAMGCSIDMYDDFNDWSNVAIAVEGIMGTGFTGRLREVTIDILNDIDTMRSQYNFDLWAIDATCKFGCYYWSCSRRHTDL